MDTRPSTQKRGLACVQAPGITQVTGYATGYNEQNYRLQVMLSKITGYRLRWANFRYRLSQQFRLSGYRSNFRGFRPCFQFSDVCVCVNQSQALEIAYEDDHREEWGLFCGIQCYILVHFVATELLLLFLLLYFAGNHYKKRSICSLQDSSFHCHVRPTWYVSATPISQKSSVRYPSIYFLLCLLIFQFGFNEDQRLELPHPVIRRTDRVSFIWYFGLLCITVIFCCVTIIFCCVTHIQRLALRFARYIETGCSGCAKHIQRPHPKWKTMARKSQILWKQIT